MWLMMTLIGEQCTNIIQGILVLANTELMVRFFFLFHFRGKKKPFPIPFLFARPLEKSMSFRQGRSRDAAAWVQEKVKTSTHTIVFMFSYVDI